MQAATVIEAFQSKTGNAKAFKSHTATTKGLQESTHFPFLFGVFFNGK